MEKTIEIQMQELREQIANEIQDAGYVWLGTEPDPIKVRKIINQAAEIARGK